LKKRVFLLTIGVLISLAALYWFVKKIEDPSRLYQALREADYRLVLLAAVFNFCSFYFIRSHRWQLFLRPIKHVSYWHVFRASCIGFMTSNLLPLRPGEIIRPYVLHRLSGISFGKTLGTAIGLERPFDYLGLTVLVLITWPLLPKQVVTDRPVASGSAIVQPAESVQAAVETADAGSVSSSDAQKTQSTYSAFRKGGWILVGAMTVGVTVMLLIGRFPDFFTGAAGKLLFFLPIGLRGKVVDFIGSFTQAMTFMKRPGLVLLAALESVVIWTCVALSHYMLIIAFRLDLPLRASFFCMIAICWAITVPQAPGFLGVFSGAALLSVNVFGARGDNAWAFAAMIWAVSILPVIFVGLGCMYFEGFRLSKLARSARQSAQSSEGQGRVESEEDTH